VARRSTLKPNDYKAIGWYCEKYDYIPQVSAYPQMYFKPKGGGEMVQVLMQTIINEYKESLEEDKRAGKSKVQRLPQ
jgi:hypothetical protein